MTNLNLFKVIFSFLLLNVVALGYQNASQNCSQLHPKCLFIAAVGLSGSTTVMDIVNQHPDVHIRGENYALFDEIMRKLQGVKWQLDYDQAIKDKDWRDIERFSTVSYQEAYNGVGQMFKQFFGHGENKNKIIGFKEIRLYSEQQLDFLRGLCQESKFIFQYHDKVEQVANRNWYEYNPVRSQQKIQGKIHLFHSQQQKYPNDTFISTVGDFKNPDYIQNLFQFLGLSLEGINIDTGRMYKKYPLVTHSRQQLHDNP